MRKVLFILSIQFLCCFFASAQKAQFEFYTSADGLAGNNTSKVTQDRQGLLWFINDGKLHQYNGQSFQVYLNIPKKVISNHESFISITTYQDSLLFVMSQHYYYLFNPETDVWKPIEKKNEADLFFEFQDNGKNEIILHTSKNNHNLDFWSFKNDQISPILIKDSSEILNDYYWIGKDRTENLYLTHQDTFYQFDVTGQLLTKIPLTNICTDCYCYSFQFDDDDNVILMVHWNFFIFDKKNKTFTSHPANRFLTGNKHHLHRFLLEEDGSFWACGHDRNLIYYDARADTLYNFHEKMKQLLPYNNDFKNLTKDKTGVIWVNTRLGLLKIRPQTYPFDNYFTSPNASNAFHSFRGFAEDEEGIIYGYFYYGIAKFDPTKNKELQTYSFYPYIQSFNLFADSNNIWINGIQSLDPESGKLKNTPGPFNHKDMGDIGFFTQDNNQRLWWIGHRDLVYLDSLEEGVEWKKELTLPTKELHKTEAMLWSKRSETFWISFKGKLLQYNPKNKKQTWFDSQNWSRILAIHEDTEEKLWLATDNGLVHFNPINQTTQQFTLINGLPNNFVCGMLSEGDSALWLSTNHGLSRFHIPSASFINFFEKDGLSHNEFNRGSYFKAKDGRMFFGGLRGINAFFPEKIMEAFDAKNNPEAQLILTSFNCTDDRGISPVKITKPIHQPVIHLNYWEWSYHFEFVLTDYHNPAEILYSYQMDGYKNNWSEPSKFNFVRYNSLPKGNYIFRVKARNPEGSWHPNELAVKVIVHPPWWETQLAYFCYFILSVGLIVGVLYSLKKRWQLQNELLFEQQEANRLKELDNFKSKLYTNLTHEFRTPLTIILGMVGQIRNNPQKYLDEGTHLIETNGKNLLRLINQLLDLSKLENRSFQLNFQQSDIIPYLRYITESFHSYANGKNISLRFYSSFESIVMDYDIEQIKQVMTNLISNAVKFTPSGGEIIVRVSAENEKLQLEIKDTGIGISKNNLPHIFDRFYQVDGSMTRKGEGTGIGLAHTQELVHLMEGSIIAESVIEEGTTFKMSLPIKNKAIKVENDFKTTDLSITNTFKNNIVFSEENKPKTTSLPQLLIIEDNPDVVTYLKSCLSNWYQINVAYNGRIGIEKALETIPDIIISDVMMPEKDGFEVCDILKNDEKTSHIPLILLTAKADFSSKIAGLKRGADAYLSKPFDKEELLIRLKVLVERQKKLVAYFSKNHPSDKDQLTKVGVEEAIQIEDVFIQKIKKIIEENYSDENFALPQLCQKIRMSRSQLFRKMKALVDTSPSSFIRNYRLEKAKHFLQTTDMNVSEVSWKVGFKDVSHFSKSFQAAFGHPPSTTNK